MSWPYRDDEGFNEYRRSWEHSLSASRLVEFCRFLQALCKIRLTQKFLCNYSSKLNMVCLSVICIVYHFLKYLSTRTCKIDFGEHLRWRTWRIVERNWKRCCLWMKQRLFLATDNQQETKLLIDLETQYRGMTKSLFRCCPSFRSYKRKPKRTKSKKQKWCNFFL